MKKGIMYTPARFSQEEQRNRARSIHNASYLVILRIIDNIQTRENGRKAALLFTTYALSPVRGLSTTNQKGWKPRRISRG
jgi:hypothetical protein